MNPTFNIRALLLDLDGLLIDSEPIYRSAWQSAAADLGYELSNDLYLRLIGLSDRDAEEALIQTVGSDFPLARFRGLWPVRWRHQVDRSGIPVKPGLWDFLKVIEKHRLPAAVATSSDSEQVRKSLFAAGLHQRFSGIVTGDQVPKGKPAPDIFLEAAGRLGVLPHHCLVLEDSEAGVLAAKAAGMNVLMIPDLKQPSAQTAALACGVLASLKEAAGFVERIFVE